MNRLVFLFAAPVFANVWVDPEAPSDFSNAPAQFQLYKLEEGNSFGAMALDGSPAAFYFHEGSSDNWAFYFQGGGWCYSLADCWGRSQGNLGSSTRLPPTGSMGGLLSDDCSVSPICDYNVVWMAYLDGNSFSGMLNGPVNYTTPNGASVPLYFRGRYNIDAIVDAVSRNVMNSSRLLKNAVNLVETGCSAGGLATFLHADYIRDTIPHSGAFYSLPISGYFLDYPSVANGTFVYSQQIQSIYSISNASTNAACQESYSASGESWRCNMAEYVYPFITSNIFVLNSRYDSWQTECILTSTPVPAGSTTNGLCGSAPGWSACASDPTKCNFEQMVHGYIPFGSYFTTSLTFVNAEKFNSPGNGAFIVSCA